MRGAFETADQLEWLAARSLFEGVAAEQVALLNAHSHQRTLPPSTLLMVENQSSPVLSLIVSGTVKATLSRRGRETLLNIAGPGDVLGEVSLLDGEGHSADIVTLEETTLLWIDEACFQTQLLQSPRLCLNLAKTVTRRLRLASARIEALSTLNVQGRVAYQLLQFAREYGETVQREDTPREDAPPGVSPQSGAQSGSVQPSPVHAGSVQGAPLPQGVLIPLCLTQSDLADLTGATRTRVNQALAAMRNANLIAVAKNHHITILNPALLERRFVV